MHPLPVILVLSLLFTGSAKAQPYLANGIKIGEVSSTSAKVWVRLTELPGRNVEGAPFDTGDVPVRPDGKGNPDRPKMETATSDDPYYRQVPAGKTLWDMADAVKGMTGFVRLILKGGGEKKVLRLGPVKAEEDFTAQFDLEDLVPDTKYQFTVVASATSDGDATSLIDGQFTSAPESDQEAEISFTVVTGSRWKTMDHPDGHNIYVRMKRLNPTFFIHTGDIVYYDHNHPYATHIDLARFRWNRMYALPRIVAFHNKIPSYFIRDDHDTWQNDCWPGQTSRMGHFTMEEGQAVFQEQTPMSDRTFRTFRWGKDLQVWMTEGRDFRSPNTMPDGPDKTIWGREQMAWFKESVQASDATFRILISPSPIVGPDHANKFDNHSNVNFTYEGDLVRKFMAENNMIVVCGDRHWQYSSQDTKTGLLEYSCGPTTDEHSTPLQNDDQQMIRYVGARGGFLSVTVDRRAGDPRAVFRHHGVDGKVVNEEIQVSDR